MVLGELCVVAAVWLPSWRHLCPVWVPDRGGGVDGHCSLLEGVGVAALSPPLHAPGEYPRFLDQAAAALCVVLFLKTSSWSSRHVALRSQCGVGVGASVLPRRQALSGKAWSLFCTSGFRCLELPGEPRGALVGGPTLPLLAAGCSTQGSGARRCVSSVVAHSCPAPVAGCSTQGAGFSSWVLLFLCV